MNLFWLLLLAHLIGDFPLQTDRVFYVKKMIKGGLWLHVGIWSLCNLVFTIPYLKYPLYWFIFLALVISHYIYDYSKIKLTEIGIADNFPLFILDQVLHVSTAFAAALFFYYLYPQIDGSTFGIWSRLDYIQPLSGFVFIVFAITPMNYFIINDYYAYFKGLKRPHWQFPSVAERKWGYIERACISIGIFFQSWYLIIIPLGILMRFIFGEKSDLREFWLSIGLTIASVWLLTVLIS